MRHDTDPVLELDEQIATTAHQDTAALSEALGQIGRFAESVRVRRLVFVLRAPDFTAEGVLWQNGRQSTKSLIYSELRVSAQLVGGPIAFSEAEGRWFESSRA